MRQLLKPHEVLARRESAKYAALLPLLGGRSYQFEFPLDGYVYDLALYDDSILVEFDGPYHCSPSQRARDLLKDAIADLHGWRVERVAVPSGETISAQVLHDILARLGPVFYDERCER